LQNWGGWIRTTNFPVNSRGEHGPTLDTTSLSS